jgi:hypothetical protein
LQASESKYPTVAAFIDSSGYFGTAGVTYFFPIYGTYEILGYNGTVEDTVVFAGNTWGVDLSIF